MRAIALAIWLAGFAIGAAIRKAHRVELEESLKSSHEVVMGISIIAFTVCLIGGW